MTKTSEEAKDRAAIVHALSWLLDRPKTMLVIIALLGGTGLIREGSRIITGEVGRATVAIDEAKVRFIMKEELASVIKAQDKIDDRLASIESALVQRGLRADASLPFMKGD